LLNAVRQAFGIARRATITWEDAVALTRILAPEVLREDSPFVEAFESELVRLYRERSRARSEIEQRKITPSEMLGLDIQQLEDEIRLADPEQSQAIRSQLSRLARAQVKFDTAKWTESQVITRDTDAVGRDLPISHKGQGYTEYRLAANRWLRVRVLHPDPPESRSGVDMIYETYWDKATGSGHSDLLVRIAVLQYKMWDGNVLYTSQSSNLRPQMEKMHQVFCEAGLCDAPNTPGADDRYRLPHCCGFLRPTDRTQTRDAWKVTHAWHVPICVALEDLEPTDQGHELLRSKRISCKAITQTTFQELYNRSMLGSRWLNPTKLHELYTKIGIFDDLDRVVVHAQEY